MLLAALLCQKESNAQLLQLASLPGPTSYLSFFFELSKSGSKSAVALLLCFLSSTSTLTQLLQLASC